ncbi:RDD family protein [Aliiroseovarius sp. PTFE2010]|uniref:RDD family protein n=1 Tax=Aliiroseovarius sp. PTFE2010 TaxID=3417190 RepID=UPI003CF6A63A
MDSDSRVPYWGLPDPYTQGEFYDNVPTKRLVAFVFDWIIIGLITALLVPFTAFTALFYLPFLAMVVGFAYRTITIANGSATLGMRLTGIEFRKDNGETFDLMTAAAHTLLYSIFFSMFLPQVLSIVLMLTTERGQSLPDVILRTAAIKRARD